MAAYLYIRFSTDRQQEGSSYDRQKQLAHEYCTRHGVELPDGNIFFDSGVSAYSGANTLEGSELHRLKALLKAGDVLLIEDQDRLSRQSLQQAIGAWIELLNKGITLITTKDGKEYKPNSDSALTDFMTMVMKSGLAHDESKKKSERIARSWVIRAEIAAKGGTIKLPKATWLTYAKDGKGYALDAGKAAIVRRMFEECISGVGAGLIAKGLNADGVTAWRGKGWNLATVYSILRNTATYGTYTPDRAKPETERMPVVENYFPAVVSKEMFELAGHRIDARKNSKTMQRQKRIFNLYADIGVCGVCGLPMHAMAKGIAKHRFLVCSSKIKGLCKALNISAELAENALREILLKLPTDSLLGGETDTRLDELDLSTETLRGSLHRIQEYIKSKEQEGVSVSMTMLEEMDRAASAYEKVRAEREKHIQAMYQAEQIRQDKAWMIGRLQERMNSSEDRSRVHTLLKTLGVTIQLERKSTEPIRSKAASKTDQVKFTVSMSNEFLFVLICRNERYVLVTTDSDTLNRLDAVEPDAPELIEQWPPVRQLDVLYRNEHEIEGLWWV